MPAKHSYFYSFEMHGYRTSFMNRNCTENSIIKPKKKFKVFPLDGM